MAKRICMVAYTHYRTDARPRREAESLAARGDHVDFVALDEAEAPRHETIGGVHVIRLTHRRYRGGRAAAYAASYAVFFARAFVEVSRRHLKQRYDVIHIHTMPDAMVFVAGLAKLTGARVVLDVHDTMPELYRSKFGLADDHPLIRALRLQERLSCRFADAVICVHEPHRQLVAGRGVPADKIGVLLNVPDPKVFGPVANGTAATVDLARPRLVYHGTIAGRLGLDIAVQAFAKVREAFGEARFDIYGAGDDAERLRQLIDRLGLAGPVQFSGRQFAVDDVPRLLQGAAVGIVSNRNDPATRYMLPVKLLEYAHLGIPAVAPRLFAIEHHFTDAAVTYYDAGDADSLAAAITSLLRDPERWRTQRRHGCEFARAHAWSTLEPELFSITDRVSKE